MASRSAVVAKKPRPSPRGRPRLSPLPEWNLADLYAGIDAPEIKRDLDRVDADSLSFEEAYKGKLGDRSGSPSAGASFAAAVRRYEALDDLIGRLTSYASLVRASDLPDPARAK